MKISLFIITIILISSCSINTSEQADFLLATALPSGKYVKESGKTLINRPYGFTKIIADSVPNNAILTIAVHGYDSKGYEWVKSLIDLAEKYSDTYFYRYDWEVCPDVIGRELAGSIDSLLLIRSNIKDIKIFGHSYGGVVVTFVGAFLNQKINTEIHTIAAPLAGYPRIFDKCDFNYLDNSIVYPGWNSNITHYQWRTQQDQDGAFSDMTYDPQEIVFENGEILLLPATMNGQRLGHNWSITWVIDNYLNM